MTKKFLALAFLSALMFGQVYAQSTTTSPNPAGNPGGIIIKAGVNFSNITTSADGSYRSANTLTSYNAGVLVDLPLASMFSVQPGLVLTGKGAKADHYYTIGGVQVASTNAKLMPYYLEIPVNFLVKLPITTGTNFFVGAGPYGAFGVGGKYKAGASVAGLGGEETHNLKFGNSSSDDLKKFDYGINALAGLEIDHVMLNINYGLGLAKIIPNTDNNANDKSKYRVLSVNVGYRF